MAGTRSKISKMGLWMKKFICPTEMSLLGHDLCWWQLRAERTPVADASSRTEGVFNPI